MEIFIRKDGWHLVASNQDSLEYVKKMKRDTDYRVVITEARNWQFHKKLFALLGIGFHNTQVGIKTEDGYREYILIKAGHFYTNTFPDYVQFKAKSISYEKLSQNKFDELYPAVRQVVAADLSITSEDLELQVMLEF